MSVLFLLVGCLPILLLLLQRYNHTKSKRIILPPGPKGNFFTGVKDQISSTPWKTYVQWAEYYKSRVLSPCTPPDVLTINQYLGPIISFWVYNQRIIVLNDHKSVRELLDRRANIYSDRPKSWMFHELCGRGKSVFNISSLDSRHSKYRKLMQHELSGRAIREYHSLLESEADIFVESLTKEPHAFQQHLRRYDIIIMSMVILQR